MTRHRYTCSRCCSRSLLAAVAAGCGGDDDDEEAGGTATTAAAETGDGGEAVSGIDQRPRRLDRRRGRVLPGRARRLQGAEPGRERRATSRPRSRRRCSSTAVEGGNPPDLAALPQPGFMRDFVERGALKPIDFARDTDRRELLRVVARPRHGRRQALRRLLQGRQQVDRLVQRPGLRGRRASSRRGLGRLPRGRRDAQGRPACRPTRSAARTAGRSPTCSRTSTSARPAREKYDQLTDHEIPWTDQSVKEALTEMGKIFGDTENIAGGTNGALQTDFPTSVTAGLRATRRRPRQVIEGDFVGGVISDETTGRGGDGLQRLRLPGDRRLGPGRRGRRRRHRHVQGQPGGAGADRVPRDARGGRDLGRSAAASRRRTRTSTRGLPGRDPEDDGDRLANAEVFRFDMSDLHAGRVRRRRDVHDPAGLPQEPGRRRRDSAEARGGGEAAYGVVDQRAAVTSSSLTPASAAVGPPGLGRARARSGRGPRPQSRGRQRGWVVPRSPSCSRGDPPRRLDDLADDRTIWRSLYSDLGRRVRRARELRAHVQDDEIIFTAIKNNALWVLIVPAAVTAVGLVFAVLTERVWWATRSRSPSSCRSRSRCSPSA